MTPVIFMGNLELPVKAPRTPRRSFPNLNLEPPQLTSHPIVVDFLKHPRHHRDGELPHWQGHGPRSLRLRWNRISHG